MPTVFRELALETAGYTYQEEISSNMATSMVRGVSADGYIMYIYSFQNFSVSFYCQSYSPVAMRTDICKFEETLKFITL